MSRGPREEAAAPYRSAGVPMIDEPTLKTRTVSLRKLHLKIGRIELVEAEIPVRRSPFALIHYKLDGQWQRWAHRLDLDKRAFMDTFESGSPEEVRAAADKIADYLRDRYRPEAREKYSEGSERPAHG